MYFHSPRGNNKHFLISKILISSFSAQLDLPKKIEKSKDISFPEEGKW